MDAVARIHNLSNKFTLHVLVKFRVEDWSDECYRCKCVGCKWCKQFVVLQIINCSSMKPVTNKIVYQYIDRNKPTYFDVEASNFYLRDGIYYLTKKITKKCLQNFVFKM
ncbi:hypothetical protein AsGV029 [Agrotis segetum granulovirus]|uniref:Uncharacterized protein n=1 Tax=Agrotis segetum granulosis virus TaxID=10464 RepID=A0A023MID5_GVAS|nr:hypothetical protein AsGV029 [Agrotis segetum granulovirus]AHN92068.1 hypothetical protein AsGV029 [Agrotis segetum granulovirus]AKN63303.1 hypothetical protein AsGV029 [Agrotis segetum granulovirus]